MKEINKHDVARELEEMAYLLNVHGICDDTQPLYKAQGVCLRDSNETNWSYKIKNLIFRVPVLGHTIPHDAADITVSFSLTASGPFHPDEKVRNPLTDLEFNVEVTGSYINNSYELVPLISCWHLDKHIKVNEVDLTKFIHPEYHMTYGGRKMWNIRNYEYGHSLILPTPRLCHPPLDGILGIDFILNNYMRRESHKRLTVSKAYRRLVAAAQMRLWKPYYLSIAKNFASMDSLTFNNCISTLSLVPNMII